MSEFKNQFTIARITEVQVIVFSRRQDHRPRAYCYLRRFAFSPVSFEIGDEEVFWQEHELLRWFSHFARNSDGLLGHR